MKRNEDVIVSDQVNFGGRVSARHELGSVKKRFVAFVIHSDQLWGKSFRTREKKTKRCSVEVVERVRRVKGIGMRRLCWIFNAHLGSNIQTRRTKILRVVTGMAEAESKRKSSMILRESTDQNKLVENR